MLPKITNSISLGSSTLKWKDVNLYNLKFANGTVQNTAPPWTVNGSNIYYNLGNVGIGTTTPAVSLDVSGNARVNGLTIGLGGGNISSNTALGYHTLFNNYSGGGNTAIGYQALLSNNNDYGLNTAVGYFADVVFSFDYSIYNAMALGSNAMVNASNKVVVGDGNVTDIGGQ